MYKVYNTQEEIASKIKKFLLNVDFYLKFRFMAKS